MDEIIIDMTNPLVSIIIVNYCGKIFLKKCLESLSKTEYQNYEVIVVDNNSTDGSVEFLNKSFPEIQLIKLNKNYGFTIPNNMAAKMAKGKYLVFLNNDTIVTNTWISELIKALETDKTIVIGQSLLMKPDVSVDSSGDFVDGIGRSFSERKIPQKLRYILSARGASMMVRKDAFLELGGFDESFFASYEDVELGWKAWLWGYKVVVVPTSIVYHTGGQTVKQLSKKIAFHGVKNSISLRMTNLDWQDSIKSIIVMSTIIFVQKLFGISLIKNQEQRFNIPNIGIIFNASWWILKNLGQIRKKRKLLKSRKIRTNQDLKKMGLITHTKR